MSFELQPSTEAGRQFVAQAESHARDFAGRADEYDRAATFPIENLAALRRSGFTGATVPKELGGGGLDSVLDFAIGIGRLGRGDASTALAANMHVFRTWFIARAWRASLANGDDAAAKRSEQIPRGIAAGEVFISAILSEAGTDHLHLRTEATRVNGGWRINGRKSFGTGSPAATLLGILVRYQATTGDLRMGLAHVSAAAPGVEIKNNWDALGMRSSGSHDVVFTDCFVPEEDMVDTGPWGRFTERYLAGNAVGTLGLVSVFLSRMYRDVRAGPFMQPFSPNEATEYIGKVTLGVDPTPQR